MAVLNNYSTAEAVEAALNKGVEAYTKSTQNETDILSVNSTFELLEDITYSRDYGKAITIDLSKLEFYKRGTINANGSINEIPASNHAIFKLKVNGLKSFDIISNELVSTTVYCCAFYSNDNTVVPYSAKELNRTNTKTSISVLDTVPDDGYMLITWFNYFNSPDTYYSSINNVIYRDITSRIKAEITEDIEPIKDDIALLNAQVNKEFITRNFNEFTFHANGYVNRDGGLQLTGTSHAIYKTIVGNIKNIKFKSNTEMISAIGFGAIYTTDGQYKQNLKSDGTTNEKSFILNADPTDILYVSWYNYLSDPTSYYDSCEVDGYPFITDTYHSEIAAIANEEISQKYHNCVKKPIDFNEKKLQFFGDSITYGYIADGGRANNNYPKVFSEAVNAASYKNEGVSGSTLSVVSGYGSIYNKIQESLDTTADIIFISGGINDWQLGVDAATLTTAVENICDYLSQNYNGEVIFITPINHAGRTPINEPTQRVDSVRKIITETALTYGYSVVQGWQFPFPVEGGNASYISAMFQDKLHPTELGYSMYAQALRNAVC